MRNLVLVKRIKQVEVMLLLYQEVNQMRSMAIINNYLHIK
jgi:hypothetical protein